jgi:hypothetical protein
LVISGISSSSRRARTEGRRHLTSSYVDVFWKGTNGHLLHKRYNGSWATTDDLGGTVL